MTILDTASKDLSAQRRAHDRFAHIDTLRAVAVLLVVVHHFLEPVYEAWGQSSAIAEGMIWIASSLNFGRMGVNLFFIISGYVIGHSICRHPSRNTLRFTLARVFRLYPVYWASVGLAYIAGGESGEATLYLVNLTMLQDFFGVPPVVGVYWTLTVELVFYAACIGLFHVAVLDQPLRLIWVLGALVTFSVAAACVRYAMDIPIPYAWPMFLSFFISGILMREMDNRHRELGPRECSAIVGYLVAGLVIAVMIYGDQARYSKAWYQEFNAQAGAVFLFVMFFHFRPSRPSLACLGIISYSVYLFHSLVGTWLLELIGTLAWITKLHWSMSLTFVIFVVVLFSSVTYWAIERPAVNFGRRAQQRFCG